MCVLDGQTEIYPLVIPESAQLVHHNQLLAHLFNVLTKCPAMQLYEINPGKSQTIHSLLSMEYPPIKSTGILPTPYVTPRTIGYIHTLIVDFITLYHSDACNTLVLSHETMILEVLDKQSLFDF